MFDGEVGDMDSGAALAAAADLRALTHRAKARLLRVAAHWADLHAPDPDDPGGPGGGADPPGNRRSVRR